MTIGGEFKAPTVQRLERDPNRQQQFFEAELKVASTEKNDIGLIADGITKGIQVAGAVQQLQSTELDMRQKELNLQKTKLAQEILLEQKEQERELLNDITTGTEAEQIAALDGLVTKYPPKVIENMKPSILMQIRRIGANGSPIAKDVVEQELLPRYDDEIRNAQLKQEMALEQIAKTGEQQRITKREFPPVGSTGTTASQNVEIRKQEIARRQSEKDEKEAQELRTRDYEIAMQEIAQRTHDRKTGNPNAVGQALINALSVRKLEVDKAARNAQDGRIVINGRETTLAEADANAINSILSSVGGTLRQGTAPAGPATIQRPPANTLAAVPPAIPAAPSAPVQAGPATAGPVAGPSPVPSLAPGAAPPIPSPTPDLQPRGGEGIIVTPGGQKLDAAGFENFVEQKVQAEIEERRAQGQFITPEKEVLLRDGIRKKLMAQLDEAIDFVPVEVPGPELPGFTSEEKGQKKKVT